MFVVASGQHFSEVASRLHISARALSIILLALLDVILIVWAVETPADQLGQEIQPQPTPAYEVQGESQLSEDESYCVLESFGYASNDCHTVFIETGSGAVKLASITDEVVVAPTSSDGLFVQRVEFLNSDEFDPDYMDHIATSYCFPSKDVALSALRGTLDDAELLGKIDSCYIAVYSGTGPEELKSAP
jgi:hypothetical protein